MPSFLKGPPELSPDASTSGVESSHQAHTRRGAGGSGQGQGTRQRLGADGVWGAGQYLKARGLRPAWCGSMVVRAFCSISRRRYVFSSMGRRRPIPPSSVAGERRTAQSGKPGTPRREGRLPGLGQQQALGAQGNREWASGAPCKITPFITEPGARPAAPAPSPPASPTLSYSGHQCWDALPTAPGEPLLPSQAVHVPRGPDLACPWPHRCT